MDEGCRGKADTGVLPKWWRAGTRTGETWSDSANGGGGGAPGSTLTGMTDWFDKVLPIATLVIGAGGTNFLKRGELRRAAVLEAGDQLGELPSYMWAKGHENGWIELNNAIERLTVRLSLAGVPDEMTVELASAARWFWRSVEEHDVPEGTVLGVDHDADRRWRRASAYVSSYLRAGNPVRRFITCHSMRGGAS